MPVLQDCLKTAKTTCFSLDSPKLPRINTKIPTLALEAFPMFAFARGTHDRGRCFPAFPRRKCRVRAQHPSPDPSLPWEKHPQRSELPGDTGQILTPDSSGSGNCGENGMLMLQELGEIAPARRE